MKITTLLTDDAVLAEIGALDAMPGLKGLIPEPGIIAEVQAAVARWREFAGQAGVPTATAERIGKTLHLQPYQ